MLFDALQMKFRVLKLQKDRECPVCGDHPTVTKLIDYEQFCGITPAVKAADRGTIAAELETTVENLKERLDRGDVFLLDVREPASGISRALKAASPFLWASCPASEERHGPDARTSSSCKSGVRSAKRSISARGASAAEPQADPWISRIDPSLHSY
jgi:adenylyltransferase/sulfurtransferase